MFSEESKVSMGNGSFKNISELRQGDYILNKFNDPVKVYSIQKINQQQVLRIELNNGTEPFYTTPDTLFLCSFNNENQFVSKYLNIREIKNLNAKLKISLKIFSNETNVNCNGNDNDNNDILIKNVYKLTTLDQDNTESYFINGVITKYQ